MAINFRYGPYELRFDPDEPMTMLDVVALRAVSRDLGIDAPNLAARALTDLHTAGEASIALAFLCAVRNDRDLGWREFLAAIPADARPEIIHSEAAPAAKAEPATAEPKTTRSRRKAAKPAGLAEALTEPAAS